MALHTGKLVLIFKIQHTWSQTWRNHYNDQNSISWEAFHSPLVYILSPLSRVSSSFPATTNADHTCLHTSFFSLSTLHHLCVYLRSFSNCTSNMTQPPASMTHSLLPPGKGVKWVNGFGSNLCTQVNRTPLPSPRSPQSIFYVCPVFSLPHLWHFLFSGNL